MKERSGTSANYEPMTNNRQVTVSYFISDSDLGPIFTACTLHATCSLFYQCVDNVIVRLSINAIVILLSIVKKTIRI